MSKLGVMVGLPRSGKSTKCMALMEQGHVIINPDRMRLALHGQAYQPLAEQLVWAIADLMVRTLLMQGHNVIVDATNITRYARGVWAKVAKAHGIELDIYWVTTPYEVCLERNKTCLTGRVDEAVITRMHSGFQEPNGSEGVIHAFREGD
jgi:predicted kinase